MAAGAGTFVVLDGVDGCGKTTQAQRLVTDLAAAASRAGTPPPLHVREPGTTAAGERIRAVLLDPDVHLGAAAEALLFAAARRQMLDELVRPALAAGRDVVCERFHPATFAYQAVAGELDEDRVLALLETWCGDPRPDVELILDVDVAEAARRRGPASDRIEGKGLGFQERVAEGFRRYAQRAERARVVDGRGEPDEVAARVRAALESSVPGLVPAEGAR